MYRILALLIAVALALTAVPGPAAAQQPKLKLAQAVHALSFAPVYVARSKNFFRDEGLDVEVLLMQGGTPTLQALTGRSVEFIDTSSGDVGVAYTKGIKLLAVQNTINQTMELVVSRKLVDEKRLTRRSPLAERVKALKGITIGVTGFGAASDIFVRFILKKYAAMDPAKDVQMVQIGGTPSQMAALKANKTQAFLSSPPPGPQAEHDGYGYVLIPPTDVAEFREFVHEVLVVRRDYAEDHPEIVEKVARAISRGNNLVLDNIEEAKKLVAEHFPKMAPEVLNVTMDAIRPQVRRDGRMTEAQWKNVSDLIYEGGMVKQRLDTKEGGIWTNRYIKMSR